MDDLPYKVQCGEGDLLVQNGNLTENILSSSTPAFRSFFLSLSHDEEEGRGRGEAERGGGVRQGRVRKQNERALSLTSQIQEISCLTQARLNQGPGGG